MKAILRFLIVLIVCILVVGIVYVWRFGWPTFEKNNDKMLQSIVATLSEKLYIEDDEVLTVNVQLKENKIIFTRNLDDPKTVTFEYSNGIISGQENEIDGNIKFFNEMVSELFETVVVYNGYDAANARYSLIKDILQEKTLEKDGYQYTSINNVSRFMVATNRKINLANKEQVYFKESDIQEFEDILKNKLQYRLIEKPGIVLEKNISYARNLVFVIYENEELTQRTYNSLMALLKVVIGNEKTIEYVKTNYPVITKAGTLTLDGISISLNEGLGNGNVHYYNKPLDYKYMLVKINIDRYRLGGAE